MLPTNIFQLDYQDFSNLVWGHQDIFHSIEEKNLFKFDLILSNIEYGSYSGNIISNYLNLPMGVFQYCKNKVDFFIPSNIENPKNILLVDSICHDDTLLKTKKYFQEFLNFSRIFSYSTLVYKEKENLVDLPGLVSDLYFMPPWKWNSFTPQTHLERLFNNSSTEYPKNTFFVGFSSLKCLEQIESILEQPINNDWISTFDIKGQSINTPSLINSISNIEEELKISDYKNKYKLLIEEKIKYIKSNGITHFIEEDINQALLISENCPTTHVLYLQNQYLFKIYAKQFPIDNLIKLNF